MTKPTYKLARETEVPDGWLLWYCECGGTELTDNHPRTIERRRSWLWPPERHTHPHTPSRQ